MSLKKICLLVADNGGAPEMELKSVNAKSFLKCVVGVPRLEMSPSGLVRYLDRRHSDSDPGFDEAIK